MLGSSGFLVGRCELGCRIPFPSPSYDSRSVLAVKGSLRRAKRAPLTAPGRSEAHNLYEGKGIRGTSHLSTISASAPQSAFHRSTVLKCGRLLARSWPVPPTRNPEEPLVKKTAQRAVKLGYGADRESRRHTFLRRPAFALVLAGLVISRSSSSAGRLLPSRYSSYAFAMCRWTFGSWSSR